MKKVLLALLILSVVLIGATSSSYSALTDSPGDKFIDDNTGLTWYDPSYFLGDGKTAIDAWLASNPDWRYATFSDLEGLITSADPLSSSYTNIIGDETSTASNHLNWGGYYATADSYANILEYFLGSVPHNPTMYDLSDLSTGPIPTYSIGAWIVEDNSVVPIPGAVWLLGSGLIGLAGLRKKLRG